MARRRRSNPVAVLPIAAVGAGVLGLGAVALLLSKKKPAAAAAGPGPAVAPPIEFPPGPESAPQLGRAPLVHETFVAEGVRQPGPISRPPVDQSGAPIVDRFTGPAAGEDSLARFDPGTGLVIPGSLAPEEQQEDAGILASISDFFG